MVCLLVCGSFFPLPEGYAWLFHQGVLSVATQSFGYNGSSVLLLQGLTPTCLGRPKCSFSALWCPPPLLSCCTVLACVLLPTSSLPWLLNPAFLWHLLFSLPVNYICLRVCVVCLCLSAYACLCVMFGGLRAQEQRVHLNHSAGGIPSVSCNLTYFLWIITSVHCF